MKQVALSFGSQRQIIKESQRQIIKEMFVKLVFVSYNVSGNVWMQHMGNVTNT